MLLNTLDLIISITILILSLFGLHKGFLKSVFSLIGIVAGFLLATNYNEVLTGYLSFIKINERILSLISFLLIVVIINIILNYISQKISGFNFATKTIDKLFGFLFGMFKGIIFTSLFLLATTKLFSAFSKKTIDDSKLYPYVIDAAPGIYNNIMTLLPNAKNFYQEFDFLKDFNSTKDQQ